VEDSSAECKSVCDSDAPIWNLADIPITDNGSEISADTDSRSDIQLFSKFYLSVHNFTVLWLIFP